MNFTKSGTNIAFFGTSDRSVPILESLKNNFNLVLCVTKKDSLVGRKQEVRQTAVKKWAIENKIAFVEVDTLKGEECNLVLKALKEKHVGYGVVADFSLMIPSSIISTYKNKLINIHFSILPKYRGASPVQFALLNGDKITGITYLLVDNGLDNGAIIDIVEYKINTKPTAGELYELLFQIAAEKLPDILNKYFAGEIKPKLQDESMASYTYSRFQPKRTFIFKEDSQIDWTKSAEEIERAVLAFNPWPIAWTTLAQLELAPNLHAGRFVLKPELNRDLKVKIYNSKVTGDKLEILTLQIEGKSKCTWNDFKNGYYAAD